MNTNMHTYKYQSESVEDTIQLGCKLGGSLKAGDMIALDGMLGAGKTQFVKGITRGVGANPEHVSSPTFVIAQEYLGGKVPIIHIDAYRLESLSDLDSIGWSDEMLINAIVICEWAEKIKNDLPGNTLSVDFEHINDSSRVIHMELTEDWNERLKGNLD